MKKGQIILQICGTLETFLQSGPSIRSFLWSLKPLSFTGGLGSGCTLHPSVWLRWGVRNPPSRGDFPQIYGFKS